MNSSIKEKENNEKYSLFLDDIKDENNFMKKIDILYDIQYMELFSKILIMSRVDFTKK
jgi:predicted AAA+ superfamily ATPase